jgi:hypothetical protein
MSAGARSCQWYAVARCYEELKASLMVPCSPNSMPYAMSSEAAPMPRRWTREWTHDAADDPACERVEFCRQNGGFVASLNATGILGHEEIHI